MFIIPSDKPSVHAVCSQGQPKWSRLTPAALQPLQTQSIDEAVDSPACSAPETQEKLHRAQLREEPKGMALDLLSPVSSAFEF